MGSPYKIHESTRSVQLTPLLMSAFGGKYNAWTFELDKTTLLNLLGSTICIPEPNRITDTKRHTARTTVCVCVCAKRIT